MFSTKIVAILAILVVTVLSPALVSQAAEPPSVGTASIEDDQAVGDSVVISLSGISPGTYTAALVSANDVEIFSIGSADVILPVIQGVTQSTGTLDITFDKDSDGYDGSDLLSTYSRITVSGTDGLIAYSDALLSSATSEINAAIADGSALNRELDAAIAAAKEAQSASDKATIDAKMGTAFINIAGINAYADSMEIRANASIAAAPDEAGIGAAANKVIEMVSNIKGWANAASATASNDVTTNNSVAVQKVFVDSVVNNLNAARNGYDSDNSGGIGDVVTDVSDPDLPVITSTGTGEGGAAQAYAAARDMANFSLTASPLPAAEGPEEVVVEEVEETTHILDLGLPSVGERILASVMQMSIVIGVAFMGLGGLMFAKSRKQ